MSLKGVKLTTFLLVVMAITPCWTFANTGVVEENNLIVTRHFSKTLHCYLSDNTYLPVKVRRNKHQILVYKLKKTILRKKIRKIKNGLLSNRKKSKRIKKLKLKHSQERTICAAIEIDSGDDEEEAIIIDDDDEVDNEEDEEEADNDTPIVEYDPSGDSDADGMLNYYDNCPDDFNPGQEDFLENGIGNVCDSTELILEPSHRDLLLTNDSFNQSGQLIEDSSSEPQSALQIINASNQSAQILMPKVAIKSSEVAVLVNTLDPQSVAVADYYMQARQIPAENRINLEFSTGSTSIPVADFNVLKTQVDAALQPHIQSLAITWTEPWLVGGMSITSAFTLGYNETWYSTCGSSCCPTGNTPYAEASAIPKQDYNIVIASMLGGTNTEHVKELIDRSVIADNTFPNGDGYFQRTTDRARSVRYGVFKNTVSNNHDVDNGLRLYYKDSVDGGDSNSVSEKENVLFYLTGRTTVSDLGSNTYLPGSFADHLTSYAGRITGSNGQMSALRWLEAGASGSHGTVVEPCNYTAKFPNSSTLVESYFNGATLGQAMWASVKWPGQGIFLGDPLTKPWGSILSDADENTFSLDTTELKPFKRYALVGNNFDTGQLELIEYIELGESKPKFKKIDFAKTYKQYLLLTSEFFE